MKDDVAKVAAAMNAMDYELLWEYPLGKGRTWKTPARYYALGLVRNRPRFFIFGERSDYLTPLGLAVRAYLENRNDEG